MKIFMKKKYLCAHSKNYFKSLKLRFSWLFFLIFLYTEERVSLKGFAYS